MMKRGRGGAKGLSGRGGSSNRSGGSYGARRPVGAQSGAGNGAEADREKEHEAVEEAFGFRKFTEGEPRLGWLLNMSSVSGMVLLCGPLPSDGGGKIV